MLTHFSLPCIFFSPINFLVCFTTHRNFLINSDSSQNNSSNLFRSATSTTHIFLTVQIVKDTRMCNLISSSFSLWHPVIIAKSQLNTTMMILFIALQFTELVVQNPYADMHSCTKLKNSHRTVEFQSKTGLSKSIESSIFILQMRKMKNRKCR